MKYRNVTELCVGEVNFGFMLCIGKQVLISVGIHDTLFETITMH